MLNQQTLGKILDTVCVRVFVGVKKTSRRNPRGASPLSLSGQKCPMLVCIFHSVDASEL